MTQVPQTTWNRDVFGILNAQGKPWTDQVFGSADAAGCYLKNYALHNKKMDLSRHKVSRVSVTIRAIRENQ